MNYVQWVHGTNDRIAHLMLRRGFRSFVFVSHQFQLSLVLSALELEHEVDFAFQLFELRAVGLIFLDVQLRQLVLGIDQRVPLALKGMDLRDGKQGQRSRGTVRAF